MQKKYFFLAFTLFVILASPAAGSLTKITGGAPVYIGEQNLNIASGLQGCRAIEWFEPGADTSAKAQKNVTIIRTLEESDIAFAYTIKPDTFSGYEGNWYCEGKRPLRTVFEVRQPRITIRFWDVDTDSDITGKVVPNTANITYRIETNLDAAHQLKYRPEMTVLDSFYIVTLKDPSGKALNTIYTGNYGKTDSHGLIFEKAPMISASPFTWKDGSSWDLTSKNMQGDAIYPPGTYTVTVTQNLNRMDAMYANLYPDERIGLLESSASVTIIKPESTFVQTTTVATSVPASVVTNPGEIPTEVVVESTPAVVTLAATKTKVTVKPTYAALPAWLVFVALGGAVFSITRKRN